MRINSSRLFQVFKYTVYGLLAFNIFIFWSEEILAATVQFPAGVAIADIIDAYTATIDTAAWVVLLLMFEFETFILDDRYFTTAVNRILLAIRVPCYAFIVYAFYGYVVNLLFISEATQLIGVSDLCALATNGWSYAIDLDEYVGITVANCGLFSDAGAFMRFEGMPAAVDANGLAAIKNLAWVDVINAAIWVLVVLILESDVWLQERNRLEGTTLRVSKLIKFILYTTLLLAAIYWGIKGDFIDFWDAFLWLVAFVFIELNVFEWRKEVNESVAQSQIIRTS